MMIKTLAAIFLLFTMVSPTYAGDKIPDKYMTNGFSAAVIGAALLYMSQNKCSNPLTVSVNKEEKNLEDPRFSTDATLSIICEEDEGAGGLVIGFQDSDGGPFPVYFSPIP